MKITSQPLNESTLARAARTLARRDGILASILKENGPPPLWARKPGFSTLVHIILEQQVSLASAASIFARVRRNTVPFRPARMIELGDVHLKSLGLTRQKTAYCLHLSESLVEKRLRLSQLSQMNDDEARAALMQVKGIGRWSADIYLLMVMLRPDVWPANDLALAIAVRKLKGLSAVPSQENCNEWPRLGGRFDQLLLGCSGSTIWHNKKQRAQFARIQQST